VRQLEGIVTLQYVLTLYGVAPPSEGGN
jgi:hypothetical protein